MLAPPKRVGFRPNGAFLRCPHLLLLPHFSAHIASVRAAGRRGLSLSRTKIERPALPLPWAFYRSNIRHRQGKKCAGRLGTLAQSPGVSVCCNASVSGEKTTPRYNRPRRGQHRVSLPRRCTGATCPAGGLHKPSQRLIRGSAFLGCGVQFRWEAIGKERRGRKSATCFQLF